MSISLGLAAGVMLYVSILDIMPEAISDLSGVTSEGRARLYVLISFIAGIALVSFIDRCFHGGHHSMSPRNEEGLSDVSNDVANQHNWKLLVAAIALHNFPEGIAAFVSCLDGWSVAIPIIMAMAIHNIPIGMAIATPVYKATGRRYKAILATFLTGLASPLGALFAALMLLPLWTGMVNSIVLSVVAGIMVYISLDDLIPDSLSYGSRHNTTSGIILGFIIMAAIGLAM